MLCARLVELHLEAEQALHLVQRDQRFGRAERERMHAGPARPWDRVPLAAAAQLVAACELAEEPKVLLHVCGQHTAVRRRVQLREVAARGCSKSHD